MGIDIYARWRGQTEEEAEAQYSAAFSPLSGNVGYLREAYHGELYATMHVCREAFERFKGVREPPWRGGSSGVPGAPPMASGR